MAYNAPLTNRVRASLAKEANVVEKKMFRGIAFMVNDKMCVTVGNDEIMCRIDPALHPTVVTQEGCRPVVMNGREYKGYIYVNESVIGTEEKLQDWIQRCLAFNQFAKAAKKKIKKP